MLFDGGVKGSRGPKLENAYTGSPESGFGACLRDGEFIIATSKMCLRLRGGESGFGSKGDLKEMAPGGVTFGFGRRGD